jgi:GNAT superfamily N-acetyltransferase
MGTAERSVPATVRPATAVDAEAMGGVAVRSWEATYRGMLPDAVLDEWQATVTDGWVAAFANQPPDTPWRPWVAERDGRVVGYATTTPAKDFFLPPPDGAGELTNLYLDPAVIGTGVGHVLYRVAIDDLWARDFDPLVVWAFRDNVRAVAFYERMGCVVDVADHVWELGGVACPIVRLVDHRPAAAEA